MKQTVSRRLLSLCMALVLVLGLLPAVTVPARAVDAGKKAMVRIVTFKSDYLEEYLTKKGPNVSIPAANTLEGVIDEEQSWLTYTNLGGVEQKITAMSWAKSTAVSDGIKTDSSITLELQLKEGFECTGVAAGAPNQFIEGTLTDLGNNKYNYTFAVKETSGNLQYFVNLAVQQKTGSDATVTFQVTDPNKGEGVTPLTQSQTVNFPTGQPIGANNADIPVFTYPHNYDPEKALIRTGATWYTDRTCKTPYDFGTELTGNITLYGTWETNPEGELPVSVTLPNFSGGEGNVAVAAGGQEYTYAGKSQQYIWDTSLSSGTGGWTWKPNLYSETQGATEWSSGWTMGAIKVGDTFEDILTEIEKKIAAPTESNTHDRPITSTTQYALALPTQPVTLVEGYKIPAEGTSGGVLSKDLDPTHAYTADELYFIATAATNLGGVQLVRNIDVQYEVKFNTDGGSDVEKQLVFGKPATRPKTDPTKGGYTFVDWYYGNLGDDAPTRAGDRPYNFGWSVDCDRTIFAKFEKNCTVTFDVQGHGTAPADIVSYENAVLTAPAEPTADGWYFAGWYKDSALTTPFDFEKDTVQFDSDSQDAMTLYAKWEETGSTATLNFIQELPDGGTKSADTKTVALDKPLKAADIAALPEKVVGATKSYVYTGWVYGSSQKELAEGVTLTSADVQAGGTLNVYSTQETEITVKFVTNCTMTTEDQVLTGAQVTPTPPEGLVNDPQVLEGWYTDQNLTQKYDFKTLLTENTTLYAKWTDPAVYETVFHKKTEGLTLQVYRVVDGSETRMAAKEDTNTQAVYELPDGQYRCTAEKPGYASVEFYVTVNGKAPEPQEITLLDFAPVTGITLSQTELEKGRSLDLKALATVTPDGATGYVKHGITWALTGSTTSDGITLKDGVLSATAEAATGTVTLTATIQEGAAAAGDDGTEGQAFEETFTITIADYRPVVTFDVQGHGTAPDPAAAGADGKITEPDKPTAPGWLFQGWYKDKAYTAGQEWKFDTDTATTDTTLYAKWVENIIDVTITFAGGDDATGTVSEIKTKSGQTVTLPPNGFTREGYLFTGWEDSVGSMVYNGGGSYRVGEEPNVTMTARWKEKEAVQTGSDIQTSLEGITANNAAQHTEQINAAIDALAELITDGNTAANQSTVEAVEKLHQAATKATASVTGDSGLSPSQVGAVLTAKTSETVTLDISKTEQEKELPADYEGHTVAPFEISLKVNGIETGEARVPITITMAVPAELNNAKNLTLLHYEAGKDEPTVVPHTRSGNKTTFVMKTFSPVYLVGEQEAASSSTEVTKVELRYTQGTQATPMGSAKPDAQGNWTITLPSTTGQSKIDELGLGANWTLHIEAAEGSEIEMKEGVKQDAFKWWSKGVKVPFDLLEASQYTATQNFTITAGDGTTTKNFTITVKWAGKAGGQTYEIATGNIKGGAIVAKPNPATEGDTIALTITPDEGMKLVTGSLSYTLQTAGASAVPIDESTLEFVMPAGAININAQFETSGGTVVEKNPPQISAFVVNGISAAINHDAGLIIILLPYGTDLRRINPQVAFLNATRVYPRSAEVVNLNRPVNYTVYGTNGTTKTYTVVAYVEEGTPSQQLWDKLTEEIGSNRSWWETAEYQKSQGFYQQRDDQRYDASVVTSLVEKITGQCGVRGVSFTRSTLGQGLVLRPSRVDLDTSNFIEMPRSVMTGLSQSGYTFVRYDLGQLMLDISPRMETAAGVRVELTTLSTKEENAWKRLTDRQEVYAIEASSTRAGLTLHIDVGSARKSQLALVKYDPSRSRFVAVDRDLWDVVNGSLVAEDVSAGIYGYTLE